MGSTVAGMAPQLRVLALPEDMGSLPSTCVGLTPSVPSLPGNLTSLLASTGTAHTRHPGLHARKIHKILKIQSFINVCSETYVVDSIRVALSFNTTKMSLRTRVFGWES